MDERFPSWLRKTVGKLDFLGLPNLGALVCGLAVLGFIGVTSGQFPLEKFIFDPEMVRQGEWWRLFPYPVSEALTNPIWLLFFVLYVYFVMQALESTWGPGPLTVFVILCYAAAVGGSFLTNRPVFIWLYILENISLAFGTLFPNFEIYVMFVIPAKAKWLALLAGVLLLWQFIMGGWDTKLFLLVVLSPYLLFFSPLLVGHVRTRMKVAKNRRRFEEDEWRR